MRIDNVTIYFVSAFSLVLYMHFTKIIHKLKASLSKLLKRVNTMTHETDIRFVPTDFQQKLCSATEDDMI